jgi:hypothetical protein
MSRTGMSRRRMSRETARPGIWSADQPDEAEEVSFGFGYLPGRWSPRGRWRAGLWLIAAAVATGLALAAIGPGRGRVWPPRPRLPLGVTEIGHPLLGVRAGWELYGYGPGEVVRIQLARGRITRTAVPGLASDGPLAFLAGPGEVIIRPIDVVPGYAVPDGQHAHALSGALSQGGTVIPGPYLGTVWVQPSYGATAMPLINLDGRAAGTAIRLPSRGPWQVDPDGRGFVLLSGLQTPVFYDARPGHIRRFAGELAAVGPTRWLVVDCRGGGHCANAVVDPASGTRRILPGPALVPGAVPGVIAPDGSAAAVVQPAGRRLTLSLIDLGSGARQTITVPPGLALPFGSTLAWSPDSRWLFVVTASGGLAAVDTSTHRVENLGVALPPLSQIAIQTAPS